MGAALGDDEGEADGLAEGEADGEEDGLADGEADREADGLADGEAEVEGAGVPTMEGEGEGSRVGQTGRLTCPPPIPLMVCATTMPTIWPSSRMSSELMARRLPMRPKRVTVTVSAEHTT